MPGDQHVVGLDRAPGQFKTGARFGVALVGGCLQGQWLQSSEYGCQICPQRSRSAFCHAELQFGDDDNAGADCVVADAFDIPGNVSPRTPHQVGDDVGSEQIARHRGRKAT